MLTFLIITENDVQVRRMRIGLVLQWSCIANPSSTAGVSAGGRRKDAEMAPLQNSNAQIALGEGNADLTSHIN